MGKDGFIMIPQNIYLVVYVSVKMFHQLSAGEAGVAFRTMRVILAEGLKMFLRPSRCSDRPIPKDTKSQLTRNTMCMNQLSDFILFTEYPYHKFQAAYHHKSY